MDNLELLNHVRAELQQVRQLGTESVHLPSLDNYLAGLSQAIQANPSALDPVAIERIKTAREFALANLKRVADSDLEMFRSVISAGQSALRAAMLINGAAATTVLAFLGQLLAKGTAKTVVAPFAPPLGIFVGGVALGAMAFAVNYVGQWFYSKSRNRTGHAANFLTIIFATGSFGAFVLAGGLLYRLFRAL